MSYEDEFLFAFELNLVFIYNVRAGYGFRARVQGYSKMIYRVFGDFDLDSGWDNSYT